MGKIIISKPVKLICGLISNDEALFLEAKRLLEKKFGRVDFESDRLKFGFTNYYADELGQNLKRVFLGFKKLIDPTKLSRAKIYSDKIERLFSRHNKRRINIDPGYLDLARLVLASTKDFSHRIYLERGIHAEITLIFKNGRFQFLDWTYPDFRTDEYVNIFTQIRNIYKQQLTKV